MNDQDIEILYTKNLQLLDSLEYLYSIEKNQRDKDEVKDHLEALDLILGLCEKMIDSKDNMQEVMR